MSSGFWDRWLGVGVFLKLYLMVGSFLREVLPNVTVLLEYKLLSSSWGRRCRLGFGRSIVVFRGLLDDL